MGAEILADFPILLNELERLRALYDQELLDSLEENEFNRITELASIICNTPISLISLIDKDRLWFKSNFGLPVNEIPRDISFCQSAILSSSVFEVEDLTNDERFYNNQLVTGDLSLRFYAGHPITDSNGHALGTLCVLDHAPKKLTVRQKRALELLAQEIDALILERRTKADLINFEKLFALSNDLMFIGGTDGYFKKINPSFKKVLGWDDEVLLNVSHFDFLHPDDVKSTQRELSKLSSGESTYNFTQRFRTHSGDYRVIQWTSTPDSSGRIYGIGRDVTERNQLEEKLKHTQEMLEQTNQVARVGGWNFDIVNKKLAWTSVTKQIHGVSPDFEPDLTNAIQFYQDPVSREKITRALEAALVHGTAYDVELQIVTILEEEIWVRALGNAEFKDGKCVRLFGTFQDVNGYKTSELALKRSIETQEALNQVLIKKIEQIREQDQTIQKIQEFKFLADSVPQLIWTSNADGSSDYYNQHWIDYTGMSKEETIQRGWTSIVHAEDVERCTAAWSEAVTTGNLYEVEYRFKRACDGVYKWHLGRAIPMKDSKGQVVKWFGSCTDIDEYKRALNLENKISQYEEFNRIVAHNLRGPAGSIQMLLEMLQNEIADSSERSELIAMLSQSSATLNETLSELMKVLEVRTHQHMPYDDCKLEGIVDHIEQMLKGQFVSRKASIHIDFQCPVIQFPKLYLESIFYNMISNALKYSKADVPPELLITSQKVNGKIILSFKDNGLGIDLNKHGKDLFKLNKVFHSGFDSKGVGLFMTKTQIETFGGNIRVESQPNEGSTFIIELE